jgi:hypothetical protein
VSSRADRGRKHRRGNRRAVRLGAESNREQPLVLQDLVEIRERPGTRSAQHLLLHGLVHRIGNELRAHVEIANEPAQCELIDQRHDRVRDGGQHHEQRNDEAKRKAHGRSSLEGASP